MRFLRLRNGVRWWFRSFERAVLTTVALLAALWFSVQGVQSFRASSAQRAGQLAIEQYDFAAARTHFARAAAIRPDRPDVWLLAAQAARRGGDLDDAKKLLAEFTTRAGENSADVRLETALQAAQRGQVERDVYWLMGMADTKHPATEQILESLAIGCTEIYHFDRAGFWLQHLLNLFPKNPIGRQIRATMDNVLGQRERAMARCRELLADFPNDPKARLLLANLLFRSQQFSEACAEFEKVHQHQPNDLATLLGLTRSRDRLGQADAARKLMQELLQKFPESSEVLLEGGRFALNENRVADAERLLRHAVQLAPNDHEVHYQLGLCLERLEKTEESKFHLARFQQIGADLTRLDELLQLIVENASRSEAPSRGGPDLFSQRSNRRGCSLAQRRAGGGAERPRDAGGAGDSEPEKIGEPTITIVGLGVGSITRVVHQTIDIAGSRGSSPDLNVSCASRSVSNI